MGEEGRIVCGHRLVGRGLASDRRAWVVRGLVSERSQMLRDDVLFRPFSLFVFNLLAVTLLFHKGRSHWDEHNFDCCELRLILTFAHAGCRGGRRIGCRGKRHATLGATCLDRMSYSFVIVFRLSGFGYRHREQL